MALKEIAIESCTVDISNPLISYTLTVTPNQGSSFVKIDDSGVLVDGYQISVSDIFTASASIPDTDSYDLTFSTTASYVKVDDTLVLRVGDISDTITATPQTPNPGGDPIDTPTPFSFSITNAGQTKVLAD